ncbi:MAG: VOC family protein [Planctomycetaceae bacterium]|nr:VOC family protein [Planctomycetaceae bacterium]
MFQGGEASAALDLYREVFPTFRELSMERYGADGPGPEGTVFRGEIEIGGQRILVSDSYVSHGFGFTPSISFWVECAGTAELDRMYDALVEGGAALMPPGDYGFAPRFAWVADRFGITWQLHVAAR